MVSKIKTPFLMVNPKSYLYGKKSLELAMAIDLLAAETACSIFFTAPFVDIRLIAEHTEHLVVTAQHMDFLKAGRGMGYVVPEALYEAGARAVFLNHAEHSLKVADLAKIIDRAKEIGMLSVVCADSVKEGEAIASFSPDILLCEPTELIGTGTVADNRYVIEATERIRKIDSNVLVMIASGVSTAEDVYNVIALGADGTGATSGILQAPEPKTRVMEMIKAMEKAAAKK